MCAQSQISFGRGGTIATIGAPDRPILLTLIKGSIDPRGMLINCAAARVRP
jgi:hypothetical protein